LENLNDSKDINSLREGDYLEDPGMDRRIILK
jgi:hypothetical protein